MGINTDIETIKTSRKIVIIDDSDLWLKTVSLWIRQYNKDVEILAYDEPKGYLDKIDELNGSVDCVVIDYYLDDTIAPLVIEKIRERNKRVLIVAVSGAFMDEDQKLKTKEMKKAINAGANRATLKNFHALEMILKSHFEVRDSGMVDLPPSH